jgi:hypothetical protein
MISNDRNQTQCFAQRHQCCAEDTGNVSRSAYRGITSAALTAGITAAPGETSINLGVDAYRGDVVGAMNASHTTKNGRFNFNAGIGIMSASQT